MLPWPVAVRLLAAVCLVLCALPAPVHAQIQQGDLIFTGFGRINVASPDGTLKQVIDTGASWTEGIAIDANGNLFVVDGGLNRVSKYDKFGVRQPEPFYTGQGSSVFGVAASATTGHVFVGEPALGKIVELDADGAEVRRIVTPLLPGASFFVTRIATAADGCTVWYTGNSPYLGRIDCATGMVTVAYAGSYVSLHSLTVLQSGDVIATSRADTSPRMFRFSGTGQLRGAYAPAANLRGVAAAQEPGQVWAGDESSQRLVRIDTAHATIAASISVPPNALNWDTEVLVFGAVQGDSDLDGVPDTTDNCPTTRNPDQLNTDGDGQGDGCDADDDNDGVTDTADNCALVSNPDQGDADGDGVGNACESDADNDGLPNQSDNCWLNWNPDQSDLDRDGLGDHCDATPVPMLPGPTGPAGKDGATGPQGPQGPPGEGLFTGALLFVERGTAVPEGYTYVGSFKQSLNGEPRDPAGPRVIVIEVYRRR